MLHKLPAPLKPRSFTILFVSGIPTNSTSRSFLNVTVPLQPVPKEVSTAKYGSSSSVVQAAYVSVEYVYQTKDGIVWDMATASDAKGALPMAVQKLGIAGAIVKDVGLFMTWIKDQRKVNG
jgi:Protein of unknown function (DUF3074)